MAYFGQGDAWGGQNDPRLRALGRASLGWFNGGDNSETATSDVVTDPTSGNTQWVKDTATIGNTFATVWNSITGHAPPNATLPPMQVSTGPDMMTIALIGGAALLGVVVLMKKKR